EQVRPMADGAGLTLALATPVRSDRVDVLADAERVEQILHNLLRNAIEATPAGGAVTIAIGANDRWAELEVEDSGPGVPDDLVNSIFSGAKPNPAKQGFGVGLNLSHQLAARMNGALEVRSRLPGNGA